MNTIKEAALRAYGADQAIKDAEAADEKARQDKAAIERLTSILQSWGITVTVSEPEFVIDGVKISGGPSQYYGAKDALMVQWLCTECGLDRVGWGWQYVSTLAELGKYFADKDPKLCNECSGKRNRAEREALEGKELTDANADFARALNRIMRVHGMFDDDNYDEDYDNEPY